MFAFERLLTEPLGKGDTAISIGWPDVPDTTMAEVFDAAWPVVRAQQFASNSSDDDARLALARVIVEIAAKGVTDPEELRRRAIEEFLLGKGSR